MTAHASRSDQKLRDAQQAKGCYLLAGSMPTTSHTGCRTDHIITLGTLQLPTGPTGLLAGDRVHHPWCAAGHGTGDRERFTTRVECVGTDVLGVHATRSISPAIAIVF